MSITNFLDIDFDYGICEECNQPTTSSYWCNSCNAKRFQENFKNWTSGNNDIDKFIQHTQLSANNKDEALEWIPYDRFKNIEYIAKGGFGKVYRAIWIDGYIDSWDKYYKNWDRNNSYLDVALKSLNNSKNVTLEFINEITSHYKLNITSYIIKLYGITQDPETKNYMLVLDYAENGSLRNYLDKNYEKLSWDDKIEYLWNIAYILNKIHNNEFIHRDLHVGNILLSTEKMTYITDMGLCKPADYNNISESTQNNIYGVLPYIAPEILRGQNYTKASDIYSFGIIIYEVFSGLPPYYDVSHNENLAIKICHGFRPRFNIKIPQLIVSLIKKCLDANPLNRPTANESQEILEKWLDDQVNNEQSEMGKQIKEAVEINKNLPTSSLTSTSLGLSYQTHSEAIYTSRLLNLNNLPEPRNSNDYYDKQNDNIISIKFSESLKIYFDQNSEPKDLSQIDSKNAFFTALIIQEELKSIINDSNVRDIFFGSEDAKINDPNLYVVVDRIPTKPSLQMVGIFPIVYIEWRKFTEVGPKNFPPSKSLPSHVKKNFDDILDTKLGLEFRSKFINLTAIRLDWKIVDGFYIEKPAIVFYVIRKGIIPIGNGFFPKTINDIETDVCEGFYEKTTCLYSGDCREYKDFVSPGCSIGISDTTLAGTLGAFVKDQNNKKYLLTNDHVIRSDNQKTICQPAEDDHIVPLKDSLKLYEKQLNDLENDVIKKESYELKKKVLMEKKEEYEKKLEEAKKKDTKFASFEKGLRCNVCNVCNVEIDKKDYGVDAAIEKRLRCNVETHKVYGVDAAIALLDQIPRSINVEPNCFAISDLAFEKMFEKEEKKDPIKLSGFKNINEVGSVDNSMPIFKVGRTTGLTQGRVMEDLTAVCDGKILKLQESSIFFGVQMEKTKIHGGGDSPPIWLDRQILVQGQKQSTFMDEGDSGCVWFDENGKVIALGHGTLSIYGSVYAIGSPISVVLKALKVDLIFDSK